MLYAEKPEDLENPYLAPLLEKDLSRLPDTLVISAELCPLRDEDEEFSKRLSDAGTASAAYRMQDVMHGYLLYPSAADAVKTTFSICRSFLDGEELPKKGASTWLEIRGIA